MTFSCSNFWEISADILPGKLYGLYLSLPQDLFNLLCICVVLMIKEWEEAQWFQKTITWISHLALTCPGTASINMASHHRVIHVVPFPGCSPLSRKDIKDLAQLVKYLIIFVTHKGVRDTYIRFADLTQDLWQGVFRNPQCA